MLIRPQCEAYWIRAILASVTFPVAIHARNWILANAPAFLRHMVDEQPNGKRVVRFWQRGGGYDRHIYTAEELWENIRYIHRNPVRRKLAAQAVDWVWSSATDCAHVRKGPLPVDNDNLPWLSPR